MPLPIAISSLPSLPNLGDIGSIGGAPQAGATPGGPTSDFAKLLANQVSSLEASQQAADQAQQALATGQTNDVTSVVLATNKANLDLQLATNVRDKLVEAYTSIMTMQV